MADRHNNTGQAQSKKQPKATIIISDGGSRSYFPRSYSPESTQVMGIKALLVSTGILIILTGITITTTVVSLIFLAPIIIITSPIWVPITILMFFTVAGVLSLCGLGLAAAVVLSWLSTCL